MKKLPINEVLSQIKNNLQNKNNLILEAPPGAGKSTVVPISFLDEPWLKDKIIIMLEPRRVAARMVATRMASLLGEKVGERVGYQIKMESAHSSKTKILVVTEALLVKKLQSNPDLTNVAMIIFDEFHERSIHTDLSLALSLQVQELLRDDLKLLVMSATLNSNEINRLLENADIITAKGRMYEINNIYLDEHIPVPNYKTINSVLLSTTLKALKENSGDILVFLAGTKEIKTLQKSLSQVVNTAEVDIYPMYSALSKQDQDKALSKSSKRKIILSTNIAQTSLTIEGVSVVIDSGFEKLSRYNYATGMNHLELSFISSDSATQRAGRAGRLSKGTCYKLWHKNKILQTTTKPEILRSDLSSLVLDLALWGVDDISELKWLDIPDEQVLKSTKEVLQELNMLDVDFKITSFGKDSLVFGLHPRFSYMILKANEFGFAYEASILASLLSDKDIYVSYRDNDIKTRFTHLIERDFDALHVNSFRAKEVLTQANNFYKRLEKSNTPDKPFSQEMISVLLLFAYPDRLAKQRGKNDARYKLSNAKGAILSTEDSLFNEEYLVVASLNVHEKDSFINLASSINLTTIEEYFSSYIKNEKTIKYNKENQKLEIRDDKYFLKLKLSSKPSQHTDKKHFKKLFLDLLREEGLEFLSWSKKADNLKQKVCFVKAHTDKDLYDFSDEYLLSTIDIWLAPFLEGITTIKALKELDMYNILSSLITWENQKLLDKLAPKQIQVPSGSNIHVDYSNKQTPSLHVRIQELFGLSQTPRILDNAVALQIHLLSPASRPIQITYDLESFWKNSYDEVRKELRGKYKKHYWPEDPYEAVATSRTKKNM
jgi:ATP-dependent helicase HrpB